MLTFHLSSHRDGDHLVIKSIPWWANIYTWLVNRICPCCGFTGWLAGKSENLEALIYSTWSRFLDIEYKKEKELFRTPIESWCLADKAIYGKHDFCWEDRCPVEEDTML